MKHCLFILLILFQANLTGQDCTEIYLIRHAEKDRTDLKNKNPHLNELGKSRALKWVEVFKNIELNKIYSTNYYRTIETVTPLSKNLNLKISIYSPSKFNYKDFLLDNYGNKVLVVGHSNTIPNFVNRLINDDFYVQINDLNNSNLYMVTICNGVAKHNLLYIE